MFTTYPNIFLKVQERMKNNIAVGNLLPRFNKQSKLREIEMLISQVVFETLSTLEDEKLIQ